MSLGWEHIIALGVSGIIIIIIIALWFFRVKDAIQHFRYLKSQKETNRTCQNNYDNNPKPSGMGMIERNNCLNNLEIIF
jgi:uncharacterized membrane protein YraQ (UPF0718 family)